MKKIVALMLSLLMVFSMSTALADDGLYFTYAKIVNNFSEDGYASFLALNGMYGFVDTNGDVVIPPIYNSVNDFVNGQAKVYDHNWNSFTIDTSGAVVTEPASVEATNSNDDQNEKEVIFKTENGHLYCNGLLVDEDNWYSLNDITKVENTDSLWYINADYGKDKMLYDSAAGRLLMEDMGSITPVMSDGLIAVHEDGVGFYVNEQGVMQIGPIGTTAYTFSEGFARVKVNENYIYINTNGDIVSDVYDGATDMVGGFAIVKQDGQWFVINNQFQRVK